MNVSHFGPKRSLQFMFASFGKNPNPQSAMNPLQ
jgi:hypothetical protein